MKNYILSSNIIGNKTIFLYTNTWQPVQFSAFIATICLPGHASPLQYIMTEGKLGHSVVDESEVMKSFESRACINYCVHAD